MINPKEIKEGQHFWAVLEDKLAMMIKDHAGFYWVCGPWECSVHEKDFKAIKLIELPSHYSKFDLLYL